MRLLVLTVLPVLAACSDHTLTPDQVSQADTSPGALSGRVCDVERGTWLADAVVYTNVVEAGRVVDTRMAWSDPDGRWEIDDLPGDRSYDVLVQHGLDDLSDQAAADVFVAPGQHVFLDEPECFDPLAMPIAVVTGSYESFPDVLDAMGLRYDLIDGQDADELRDFLLDPERLPSYDLVLFEGGHVEAGLFYVDGDAAIPDAAIPDTAIPDTAIPDAVRAALQGYVRDGGGVFASDWAYDVVEQAWPARLDFAGDDTVPDAAQVGEYDLVKAAVSDQELAAWLDQDTLRLTYDLPVWAPLEGTDGAVSVHLSGDVEYRVGQAVYSLPDTPLLVSFSSGEGKVFYSSFRVAENASTEVLLTMQYLLHGL